MPVDYDSNHISCEKTFLAGTPATLVCPAGTKSFFVIMGSSTKLVKVTQIHVSGLTMTARAYNNVVARKISSIPSGGTTLLAAVLTDRFGIGIDLNKEYVKLSKKRLKKIESDSKKFKIIHGDSIIEIKKLDLIDYCVTSPPYHNILKNKGMGIRHDGSQRRQGIEYYSDDNEDVGNKETYLAYLDSVKNIMQEVFRKLKNKKYCTMIISDFTVEKKETNAHADMIKLMQEIGFESSGTTILVQDSKPLYPFGYPYAYKINHVHQYLLNFRKVVIS